MDSRGQRLGRPIHYRLLSLTCLMLRLGIPLTRTGRLLARVSLIVRGPFRLNDSASLWPAIVLTLSVMGNILLYNIVGTFGYLVFRMVFGFRQQRSPEKPVHRRPEGLRTSKKLLARQPAPDAEDVGGL